MPNTLLLAIDIGNTNTTIAAYDGQMLIADWRLSTLLSRTVDEWAVTVLALFTLGQIPVVSITHVVMSSVVPDLTPVITVLAQKYLSCEPLIVSHHTDTGLTIKCDRPGEIGSDRLCDAVAAMTMYAVPAIVIDFGTATTFNAITREGDYLGGAIAPGLGISVEALYAHAARLSHVELVTPERAIGSNTMQNLQSGIIFGYAGLVEAMICRFKNEMEGPVKTIATGGLSTVIADQVAFDIVEPLLTLHGLRIIHERSQRA